jgi:two-component system, OmpR family, alkaline phosphatase synthesis response regulator PhoP
MTALSQVTVLVVDDEPNLVNLVRSYLEREGYHVLVAFDGREAVEVTRREQPDLLVLDLMLPGLDGIEVCRQVRQFSDAYVIMLTAKTEEVDKVVGLSVGADDYLTKPFSPRELVARVKAMLRRPRGSAVASPEAPSPQQLGELSIDRVRYQASRHGTPIELTAREFALLSLLAEHPGHVFTRAHVLDCLWGDGAYDEHVVEVHIANLRKKLEADPAHPRYIETVRGVGYRFAGDVA